MYPTQQVSKVSVPVPPSVPAPVRVPVPLRTAVSAPMQIPPPPPPPLPIPRPEFVYSHMHPVQQVPQYANIPYNIPYPMAQYPQAMIPQQVIPPYQVMPPAVTTAPAPPSSPTESCPTMSDLSFADAPSYDLPINSYPSLEELEEYGMNMLDAETEDFIQYLDAGCSLAEQITIRNFYRPCFHNMLNMCSRIKSDVIKANDTAAKIHSHGKAWVLKDFISAYMRLVKCWHILHGYIYSKEGTLGSIENELSVEFKSCYAVWEHNTRELTEHMLRIFSNVDNSMQSPDADYTPPISDSEISDDSGGSVGSDSSSSDITIGGSRRRRKCVAPIVKVPFPVGGTGICMPTLHPSMIKAFQDLRANESIYFKPSNYNMRVLGKGKRPMPTIELSPTAVNVSKHFEPVKRTVRAKGNNANNNDMQWLYAITTSGVLLRKNMSKTSKNKLHIATVDGAAMKQSRESFHISETWAKEPAERRTVRIYPDLSPAGLAKFGLIDINSDSISDITTEGETDLVDGIFGGEFITDAGTAIPLQEIMMDIVQKLAAREGNGTTNEDDGRVRNDHENDSDDDDDSDNEDHHDKDDNATTEDDNDDDDHTIESYSDHDEDNEEDNDGYDSEDEYEDDDDDEYDDTDRKYDADDHDHDELEDGNGVDHQDDHDDEDHTGSNDKNNNDDHEHDAFANEDDANGGHVDELHDAVGITNDDNNETNIDDYNDHNIDGTNDNEDAANDSNDFDTPERMTDAAVDKPILKCVL